MMVGLGLGAGIGLGANRSASTPAYVPQGVQFHPEAWLLSAAAAGFTDSPNGVMTIMLRGTVGSVANQINGARWSLGNMNVVSNMGAVVSESLPFNFALDNAAGTIGTVRFNLNDSTGGTNHNAQGIVSSAVVNGLWQCYTFMWSTNFGSGLKRGAIYINGVSQGITTLTDVGTVPAFNVNYNNAAGFGINVAPGNGDVRGAFEAADWFIDTTQDPLGNGGIGAAACAAKFCTPGGVLVDPGALGTLPFGTTPTLFYSGGKAGWAAGNKGSLTSLPQTGTLYNAAYNPGGKVAGRAYVEWVIDGELPAHTAATASLATLNNGNPVVAGQRLFLVVSLIDSSVFLDRAIATPAGWTALTGFPLAVNGTGGYPTNQAIFTKIADSGDVNAAGTDKAMPMISWTANANSLRSGTYQLICVSSGDPNNASVNIQHQPTPTQNGAIAGPLAPSVTPTADGALMLCWYFFYDASQAGVMTPNVAQDLRFKYLNTSTTRGFAMFTSERLSGLSASGTRAATQTLSHPVVGASVAIGA